MIPIPRALTFTARYSHSGEGQAVPETGARIPAPGAPRPETGARFGKVIFGWCGVRQ